MNLFRQENSRKNSLVYEFLLEFLYFCKISSINIITFQENEHKYTEKCNYFDIFFAFLYAKFVFYAAQKVTFCKYDVIFCVYLLAKMQCNMIYKYNL